MHNKVQLQIGKWGNSLAIRIPKDISEALNLNLKDSINCTIENGKIVLEPIFSIALKGVILYVLRKSHS